MTSVGLLYLGIAWILGSTVCFFAVENTAMGIIWLCGGALELIVALIRLQREKTGK